MINVICILCFKQVFDKCFLGSSPSATIDSVFRGQIAAVYFFKEPQSASVISCLYKLGPCYCVSILVYCYHEFIIKEGTFFYELLLLLLGHYYAYTCMCSLHVEMVHTYTCCPKFCGLLIHGVNCILCNKETVL